MCQQEQLRTICDSFLDEAMEYNDLPGLVIGVLRGDEVFTGARGVRDVTTGDPLQAEDIFHCASVSKLFTSSAIMLLVNAGVLHLEDRLSDILPEMFPTEMPPEMDPEMFPTERHKTETLPEMSPPEGREHCFVDPRFRDVRLWQMLSHTAGIGDVRDYRWEECLTGETALSDYVHSEEVTGQPLLWAPGEGGFRYSNIAYEILGHIVSVKSAEYAEYVEGAEPGARLSYEEFVRRYLMEPAGMNDSTMLTCGRFYTNAATEFAGLMTEEIRRRNAECAAGWHPMALPHEKAVDRSIVPVTYYPYTRSHAPSSTLTSNAADLLKWAQAHMRGFAEVEAAERAAEVEAAGGAAEVEAAGRTAEVEAAGRVAAVDGMDKPGRLLSFSAYQHMQYEYAEVPNNREKMGLGWFMRRQGGYQLYGHEGTDDGFRASLWICPALDQAIVVLSNLSGAPVKKLNKRLFERLTQ